MLRTGFNSFQLKLMALFFMTLDHIHYTMQGVFEVPVLFHILGRIAAPIFFFLIGEGLRHTKSRPRYLLRLWTGSVLMQVGNLCINRWFPLPRGSFYPNIFSTLFILALLIHCFEMYREAIEQAQYSKAAHFGALGMLPFLSSMFLSLPPAHRALELLQQIIAVLVPSILTTEGGIDFVILGIAFYVFSGNRRKTALFYTFFSLLILLSTPFDNFSLHTILYGNVQWMMILALPFLLLYNGERGRNIKHLFYAYYPLHLYTLALLAHFID